LTISRLLWFERPEATVQLYDPHFWKRIQLANPIYIAIL